METERERLALTGVLLADIVLMFLPWFGKGELKILGIELMANPLTLLGVAVVMLGLWWLPRRRLTACLAGVALLLAAEGRAFFFWASGLPDPGFSLRFACPGFYLGAAGTLTLLCALLLCALRRRGRA